MPDTKYAWEGRGLDEISAKELYLFIQNDGDLYRQQYQPIINNLTTKKARGIYDHTKAAKLFGYLVDTGAKWYEYGGRPPYNKPQRIPDYFNKKLRDAVAEELRDNFETEYDLGNYNNDTFLPKKYQAKPKVKRKKSVKHSNTTSLRGMR